MKRCRSGQHEFTGHRCLECQRARNRESRARHPRPRKVRQSRAQSHAERNARYKARVVAAGGLTGPSGKVRPESLLAGDRACGKCGGPTLWGACSGCTPQLVSAPELPVVLERLRDEHYAGHFATPEPASARRRRGKVVEAPWHAR